ncbi:amyloid beta precursor protein binding protein 1, partial [Strigomonas culicis]
MLAVSEATSTDRPATAPVIADRYDRQLRLWGAREQCNLEEAHLVVLGATGPAVAALKNLILLGLRAVTLVDEQRVRPEHLTENFFLLPSDCHADTASSPFLAERTAAYLSQLNRDCACHYVAEAPEVWARRFTAVFDPSLAAAGADRGGDRRGALLQLLRCAVRVPPAADGAALRHISALLLTDRVADPHSLTSPLLRTVMNFVRVPFYLFHNGDSATASFPDDVLKGQVLRLLHQRRAPPAAPAETARASAADVPAPATERAAGGSVYDCLAPCAQLPIFALTACGMVASLQVLNEDTIVNNTSPEYGKPTVDLRFLLPFEDLRAFFDGINPDDDVQFDSADADKVALHSHIPYTCLLHFALRKVMAAQPALFAPFAVDATAAAAAARPNLQLSREVLQAMRVALNGMRRRQQPAQETFEEAELALNALLNRPTAAAQKVYQQLCNLFASRSPATLAFAPLAALYGRFQQRAAAAPAPSQTARLLYLLHRPREVLLYYILHSVKVFYEENYVTLSVTLPSPTESGAATTAGEGRCVGTHVLPFNGDLPDITTVTPWYNKMHCIYKSKHEADVNTVVAMCGRQIWDDVLSEADTAASARFGKAEREHVQAYILDC